MLSQEKLQLDSNSNRFTASERKSVFSLASIFALRMFGLFLLLPVLAIHASGLGDATPFLIGLSLGVYGLTQAIFQIPFGILSDRMGRKKVIAFGLLIFALGSIVAGLASSIEWVIIGRAIQGGGAVSAAVLALTADLTREQQRTKAMAIIGVSIGMVFMISVTVSAPLSGFIGIRGLFWLTAVLALAAIAVLYLIVPTPVTMPLHRDVLPVTGQLKQVMQNPNLLRLDFGIFVLHLILTALFVVLPMQLVDIGGLDISAHWKVYLPVLIVSVLIMSPIVRASAQQHRVTAIFRIGISVLSAALILMAVATSGGHPSFYWLLVALCLFFVGFNMLEALLPSLVSRVAPAASKGTAIGIYNGLQFLGIFVGGVLGGLVLGRYGAAAVYWSCAGFALVWLVVALIAPKFALSSSKVIAINADSPSQTDVLIDRIRQVRGVQEVTFVRGETFAYLKVDEKELDTSTLDQLTT